MFLWAKTKNEKKNIVVELLKKNKRRLYWNTLIFAINQVIKKQKKLVANRKKLEKKPKYNIFKKNELLIRENRSNRDVNWFIYFKRVLKIETFSNLLELFKQKRNLVIIKNNASNYIANNE